MKPVFRFLTGGLSLLLSVLSLSAQGLDDGWSNRFGLPGLPGTVKDIVEDSQGNLYGYIPGAGLYRWNGLDWVTFGLFPDTLEVEGEPMVIASYLSHLLLENGDLVVVAESASRDRKRFVVRYDSRIGTWRSFTPRLEEGYFSTPFKGNDGRYYATSFSGSPSYINAVLREENEGWDTILSGIDDRVDLLGVGSDGTVYLHRYSYGSSVKQDSVIWWNAGERGALPFFNKETESIKDRIMVGDTLFALRQSWELDSAGDKHSYRTDVLKLLDGVWVPVCNSLAGEIKPYSAYSVAHVFGFDVRGYIYVATTRGVLRWNGREWGELSDDFIPIGIYLNNKGGLIGYWGTSRTDPLLAAADIARYDAGGDEWEGLYREGEEYLGLFGFPGTILMREEGIYVGGASARGESGFVRGDILRFNDKKWEGFSGLGRASFYSPYVTQILPHPERGFYVAGRFDSAGGQRAGNIAWWDGEEWHPLGDTVLFNWSVYSMALDQGLLYVAGKHKTIISPDSSKTSYILARWDGREWKVITDSVGVGSASLLVDNGTIYVGGYFYKIGTMQPFGVAALHDTGWSDMGGGVRLPYSFWGTVKTFAKGKDGIYAGGSFSVAGDRSIYSLARWDGKAWHDLDSGLTNRAYDWKYVEPAAIYDIALTDKYLVAVGKFSTAGSDQYDSPRRIELGCGIAFWDFREKTWNRLGSSLCSPLHNFSSASSLAVRDDTVWVVGNFSYAGGKPSSRIARYVIPPPRVSAPEAPFVLHFGTVSPGDTLTLNLAVKNPTTSTRTLRGRVTGLQGPFSLGFDGEFQGAAGQTVRVPIRFVSDGEGHFLDTIVISHNGEGGDLRVLLVGTSTTLSVESESGGQENERTLRITPNPFDRQTRISFRLPQPGPVRLALYSLDGREAALLVDEERHSGEHSILWEPTGLAKGTYICRFEWEGGTFSRQVVLR